MKLYGNLIWFNEQGAEGGFLAFREEFTTPQEPFVGFHVVEPGDKLVVWNGKDKVCEIFNGKFKKKYNMLFFSFLNYAEAYTKTHNYTEYTEK